MKPPASAEVGEVKQHYDRLSKLYDRWWGEHLHHGYWEGDEGQARAQVRLVEKLVEASDIPRGAEVLDVGCGLGGSAVWLAANLDCRVRGITISPVQARLATSRAEAAGLDRQPQFEVMDAHHLDFPAAGFDAVWSIECTEHLHDKPGFFRSAARLLRPGGRLAICAWLAADEPDASQAKLIEKVCEGMICPSLGSMKEHLRWIDEAGFIETSGRDLTANVARTWDRCGKIIRRPELQAFLKLSSRRIRDFANAFPLMSEAYATGAMRYGMFTARLPLRMTAASASALENSGASLLRRPSER